MRQSTRLIGAIALTMAGGSSCAAAPSMSFTLLGALEENGTSTALALSRDGTTVVGSAGFNGVPHAFRWRHDTGMIDLLPESVGNAHAVSADGSVIVGLGESNAFRWTSDAGAVSLGSLAGADFFSNGWGVSADGRFAVGTSASPLGSFDAFRYDHLTGEMISVGGFEGRAVSDNGQVVAGFDFDTGAARGFIWESGVYTPIGNLGGGFQFSEVHAMTPDGSRVVGRCSSNDAGFGNAEAFYWSAETGMIGLGSIFSKDGRPFHTEATAVSADGSVIVGTQQVVGDDELIAFLWTEARGMRPLSSVLDDLGIDFGDASLLTATGISGDGRTITGLAQTIDGRSLAYVVTIPAPSAALIMIAACSLPRPRRGRCRTE